MALIPVLAFAIVAICFLLFLSYQVWCHTDNVRSNKDLAPVDLEAFRNLTDPREVDFLRANLSAREFRRIQRTRLRAVASYITAISEHAGKLVVVGRSASAHPDPEVAATGGELVQRAFQLKLWCSFSLLKLNATLLFPGLFAPSSQIADRYLAVTSLSAAMPDELAA